MDTNHQDQINQYVWQHIQQGFQPDEIAAQLRNAGWPEANIHAAFDHARTQLQPAAPVPAQPAAPDDHITPAQPNGQIQAQGQKRGRIRTSWMLLKQSLKLLQSNKRLLGYPFRSALITTLLFIAYAIVLMIDLSNSWFIFTRASTYESDSFQLTPVGWATTAVVVVGLNFIVFYYTAGLTANVLDLFRGKQADRKVYMQLARTRWKALLTYTAIVTIIGFLLNLLEERVRWIGWILSKVLGTVWKLATTFTVPIIVEDNVSGAEAIKRSVGLFKQTWGVTAISRLTVAGILTLIYWVIFVPVNFLFLMLMGQLFGLFGIIIDIAFALILGVIFVTVAVAADNIISTALYYYARYGQVPAAFPPELLNQVLVARKSRKLFGKKNDTPPAA